MISICIPVYNYDVTPLLESLIKQMQHIVIPVEIIVFNDCSTEIFIEPEFLEVTVINSEKNIGRSAAREQLANHAKFEYLLFLDADVAVENKNWLHNYVTATENSFDIIYGGVSYAETIPEDQFLLRWKYGHKRESKTVAERKNETFQNLISMGYLIKKSVFLEITNQISGNKYGQDILFSFYINKLGFKVTHIDNPVTHLGLESNESYLKKSIKGIETTYAAEKTGLLPDDFRPVQRAFLKLKKTQSLRLFMKVISARKGQLERNLISNKPRLIYLDFLKLYHYSQLKQNG